MGSLKAEVLLLRKRVSTRLLLAIAVLLTVLFGYVLPYASYQRSGRLPLREGPGAAASRKLPLGRA